VTTLLDDRYLHLDQFHRLDGHGTRPQDATDGEDRHRQLGLLEPLTCLLLHFPTPNMATTDSVGSFKKGRKISLADDV
jgi:hypothetical protein